MNRHFIVAALFVFLFGIPFANAQEAFKHWAIGIEGGTNGVGITAATALSSNFKLRAGVDFLGYTYTGDIDLDLKGYLPDLSGYSEYYNVDDISLTGTFTDAKLNFTNFKAIVDYYPMANGIFSISAGLYFGKNTISASAKIDNYQALTNQYNLPPVFDFEGLTVKPDADGSFDAKVQLGNAIKPYFGIGLGRTIANSRVGFKFDLGIIYQGDYKFKSKNIISENNRLDDIANNYLSDSDVPTGLLKLWPVINFGLSYRIF
jgi:hypothetical protein